MTKQEAEDIFDSKGEDVLDKLLDYILIEQNYDKATKFIMDTVGCDETIAKEMVEDTIPKNIKPCTETKPYVECPYCHSKNTKKISTTAKVTNTVMFGIFGTKRHKQWHCNNCKSDS